MSSLSEHEREQETVTVQVHYLVRNSIPVTISGHNLKSRPAEELIRLAEQQIKEGDDAPGPDYDEAISRLDEDGVLSFDSEASSIEDDE